MSLIIKIGDIDYTLHNEEKKCSNCTYEDEKRKFDDDVYNTFHWEYPQYHPCRGCKDFSKWTHTKRHLYQIIEYLQNKIEGDDK